jgi:hypothetical protein
MTNMAAKRNWVERPAGTGNFYQGFCRLAHVGDQVEVVERYFVVNGEPLPETGLDNREPVNFGNPSVDQTTDNMLFHTELGWKLEGPSLHLAHAILVYEFTQTMGRERAEALANRYFINFQTNEVRRWFWINEASQDERRTLLQTSPVVEWLYWGSEVRDWQDKSHQKFRPDSAY